MGLYDFTNQDARLSARVRFLEKGSLRLRRGSVVGRFSTIDPATVNSLMVQDLTKVRIARFASRGKRSIGLVTA